MNNILSNANKKKILISMLVVIIGILSYTATLDTLIRKTYIRELDNRGGEYLNEAITKAAVAFTLARGINAAISVIQDADFSASPMGFGISVSLGEILDPINDLVERSSWVFLISATSLGIQKILMDLGAWFGFKVLICVSMLIILIGIWMPRVLNVNLKSLGYKLIFISIVIRFCIPIVALASEKVYDLFLEDKYEESVQKLDIIKNDITDTDEEDLTFLETLKKYTNIREKLSALKNAVSNAIDYFINLIIVFVLQTIIIPLLVVWGLIKLTGYLFGSDISSVMEDKLKSVLRKGTDITTPQEISA